MKKDCCQSRKKVTKVRQPKKAPKLPKSNDDEQKPKKWSSDEKKTATKSGKVKKIPQPKQTLKPPEFNEATDSSEEEEE